MKLSKRMERVAGMVTEGHRLADIGTDHAYIPIYLCEEKRIPSAIAMDIGSGPLQRAREHVQSAGLSAYIELRLSNGTEKLKPGEVDTLLLSGMGGLLMESILGRDDEILSSVKELVLQPQSDITDLRQWLHMKGWQIVSEDIVFDAGKYYPMMKAVQGPYISYTIEEYHYGRLDIQQNLPVLEQYIEKHLRAEEQILERVLSYGRDRSATQAEFTKRDIRHIQKALEDCRKMQRERLNLSSKGEDALEKEEKGTDGKVSGSD